MKLEALVLDTIRRYAMLPEGSAVICGLSGGPDSVALCRVLHALQPQLRLRLIAAHVHHGIRGAQADADAAFSRDLAQTLGMEFYCAHYDVPALAQAQGIGVEACARNVRYAYFAQLAACIGVGYIATAHHADDALETALFHLARGSGIRGLSGIQPVRTLSGYSLVRPLVCASKQSIGEYLAQLGADYRIDASNACDDYARNRIRHHVIPALMQVNPSLVSTSVHTLEALRMEADFLDREAQLAFGRICSGQSIDIPGLCTLHPALQGRVIETLYAKIAGDQPPQLTFAHLAAVKALCTADSPSGQYSLPAGISARREYGRLLLEKTVKPTRVDGAPIPLQPDSSVLFNEWRITLRTVNAPTAEYKSIHNFFVDCSKIYGKLLLRPRLPGDKIHLAGHSSGTSLKKLMIDRKIPRLQRSTWPVIADGLGVVAVAELGIDARTAVDAQSRELYHIQIEKHKVEENLCASPIQILQKF